MDVGSHPPIRATARDAERLAHDLYGLEVRAVPLPSEYDDNFRLEAADGSLRVLKVMHPARESGFVDMQCAALRRALQQDPGLPVPEVILDRAGRLWSTAILSEGQSRLVWMLSWLPGRPIAGVRPVTPGSSTSSARPWPVSTWPWTDSRIRRRAGSSNGISSGPDGSGSTSASCLTRVAGPSSRGCSTATTPRSCRPCPA